MGFRHGAVEVVKVPTDDLKQKSRKSRSSFEILNNLGLLAGRDLFPVLSREEKLRIRDGSSTRIRVYLTGLLIVSGTCTAGAESDHTINLLVFISLS